MAKAFASQGDLEEKKISFIEIGKGLYAFTAEGDPNTGGMRGEEVTVYRQDAEKCAVFLNENGASRGRAVAQGTGVEKATTMMRDNHYGWFEKVDKGVYMLSEAGVTALAQGGD